MTPRTEGARRVLVTREPSVPRPTLADEVARRSPAAVLVVAPALNSRLRHRLSDTDEALVRAHDRLDFAIAALRRRCVAARGEVGDANPVHAIEDALASFAADEIVIATLPPGRSNWIERGLIESARARLSLPITHLVSDYELVEEADGREAA